MKYHVPTLLVLSFLILTSLFSIHAIFGSWWKVSTAKETVIFDGITIIADYSLLQTISVSQADRYGNQTITTFPLSNVTAEQDHVKRLQSLNNLTINITIIGAFFSVLAIPLFLISKGKQRLLRFSRYTGFLAAIFFLIATIYFASEMPPIISKFRSVIPEDVFTLPGNIIDGFWGKTSYSGMRWCWSPAAGWISAFVAFLLNALNPLLVKEIYTAKKLQYTAKP